MGMKQAGGFTIIESVVSLGVLGVLATLLLTASVNARRNTVARIGAEQFAGFLRETATFAVNGVKDQSCPVALTDPTCSRYTVAPVAGEAAYTRQSVAGGTVVRRSLPQGARFGTASDVTFSYTPPTLDVVGSRTVEVTHVSGAPIWRVCVLSNETVEVRSPVDPVCA